MPHILLIANIYPLGQPTVVKVDFFSTETIESTLFLIKLIMALVYDLIEIQAQGRPLAFI
jgi:hypothetical protein